MKERDLEYYGSEARDDEEEKAGSLWATAIQYFFIIAVVMCKSRDSKFHLH